jgi:hypothetical protein
MGAPKILKNKSGNFPPNINLIAGGSLYPIFENSPRARDCPHSGKFQISKIPGEISVISLLRAPKMEMAQKMEMLNILALEVAKQAVEVAKQAVEVAKIP